MAGCPIVARCAHPGADGAAPSTARCSWPSQPQTMRGHGKRTRRRNRAAAREWGVDCLSELVAAAPLLTQLSPATRKLTRRYFMGLPAGIYLVTPTLSFQETVAAKTERPAQWRRIRCA